MSQPVKNSCNCLTCDFRDLVFSNLENEDVVRICNAKEEIHYQKGQVINNQGEPIRKFKYLKNGLVKLYRKTGVDEEQIITITRPYEFVSNTHVFSDELYKYSLAALEDSTVCCIDIELIKEMVEKNGRFGLKLLTDLSRTSENIISLGLEIRTRNLAGRVALVLLYFSRSIYNSKIFDLPVSRREIADFISMSTANVIRTFSEFKRDGILESNGRTIEILCMEKLEIISKRG
mgnify:CR=1 FL=1